MNGSFFQNPTFDSTEKTNNTNLEDVDNIFNSNKGKQIKVYTSFPFSNEEKDKTFQGILEGTKDDALILSHHETWYLIPLQFINYITFNEKLNI